MLVRSRLADEYCLVDARVAGMNPCVTMARSNHAKINTVILVQFRRYVRKLYLHFSWYNYFSIEALSGFSTCFVALCAVYAIQQ